MSFWRDRPVLVTGVTGFLGSWLGAELLRQGATVIGLIRDRPDRRNINFHAISNRIVQVYGAIEDVLLLQRILNEYEIATVFHLAAQTIVGTANRSPLSTFTANIQGTWNLLEACRHSPRIEGVVVASSDKAYGDLERQVAVDESAPLCGVHPYDVSKSCADLISQAYHRTWNVPVAITRCGNFYGGGDLNWNRIVPGTIRSIMRDEAPVIRSDGSYCREYIYIEDAVRCYMTLAENVHRPDVVGQSFNFSAQAPISVIQLTETILRVAGRSDLEPRILNLPEARHEIPYQALHASKAKRLLGWTPEWELADGLRETVRWYHEFFEVAG